MSVTVPSQQTTGTLITNTLWNEVVDAVAHVLGMKADGDTLANADAGKAIGWDIGDYKVSARTNDIGNAWLRSDGRTIGNASSGGTARANADMEELFTHLWDEFANTELPIEDSTGTPTTRGANAAADFAANKRMPLPDLRGRVIAGMDDPTGSDAANRVTDASADTLGDGMGAETHQLTTAELAQHRHYIQNGGSGGGWTGGGANGGTEYTSYAGNDTAHNNVQPTLFLNYFIYTGN